MNKMRLLTLLIAIGLAARGIAEQFNPEAPDLAPYLALCMIIGSPIILGLGLFLSKKISKYYEESAADAENRISRGYHTREIVATFAYNTYMALSAMLIALPEEGAAFWIFFGMPIAIILLLILFVWWIVKGRTIDKTEW